MDTNKDTNRNTNDSGVLHILVGLPGSGKSTYAAENLSDCVVVSSDAIREEFTGAEDDFSQDRSVWVEFHVRIEKFLSEGRDVVADATSLTILERLPLYRCAEMAGACVVIHYFLVDAEKCLQRQLGRRRQVPAPVIFDMADRISQPLFGESELIVAVFPVG